MSSTSDGAAEVASLNEPPSPKKQRTDGDKMLNVLLDSQTRELFGLQFNDILTVAKVEWVRLCNPSTSYLYQIISLILSVDVNMVKLYRQKDGMLQDEMVEGWDVVVMDENIRHGTYLCVVPLILFSCFPLLKVETPHDLDIFPVKTAGHGKVFESRMGRKGSLQR
jgi:hypothetical protein